MPLAWDRTSLSQPAPRTIRASARHDEIRRGRRLQVPRHPVEGPRQLGLLAAVERGGRADEAPELQYQRPGDVRPQQRLSGTPKPTIAKLVELPYTSEAAIYNRSVQGARARHDREIPAQYAPQPSTLGGRGLQHKQGGELLVQLLPVEPQHERDHDPAANRSGTSSGRRTSEGAPALIDQHGWIHAFLNNTADPTCGPIPLAPPSPLVNTSAIPFAPCSFSPSTAKSLLRPTGGRWSRVGRPPARTRALAVRGSRAVRESRSTSTMSQEWSRFRTR